MKNKILNWLGDVMFDLTDFCESMALKCKEASGHGLKKKLAEAREMCVASGYGLYKERTEYTPFSLSLFAIKSKKTGKYVVGMDKNGKRKLSDEPMLKGSKGMMEDYWYEYHCDCKYYEMVEVKDN